MFIINIERINLIQLYYPTILYPFQFNIAGAGGAGGGYCDITDIIPLTPIKWALATLINGLIIILL